MGRRTFAAMSLFAWGLPALLTGLCALAFTHDASARQWFRPTLAETRTCFNEMALYTHRIDVFNKEETNTTQKRIGYIKGMPSWTNSYKGGTALFYYAPTGILAIANLVCIGYALRKVRYLRKGNSVLRREEDKGRRRTEGENSRAVKTAGNARSMSVAKTILVYVKMLLMTGVVEIFAESIAWATSNHDPNEPYAHFDHSLAYRATGYVTDVFRAACVVWLAAPEDGYVGAIRKLLRRRK